MLQQRGRGGGARARARASQWRRVLAMSGRRRRAGQGGRARGQSPSSGQGDGHEHEEEPSSSTPQNQAHEKAGARAGAGVAERGASLLSRVLERAASEGNDTTDAPGTGTFDSNSFPSTASYATSSGSSSGSRLATLAPIAGIVLLLGGGLLFREPLQRFLVAFTTRIDSMGPEGYAVYMLLYIVLEVFAIPAIPLTMTGGLLFGPVAGTIVVSVCATSAATIAYLIARYVARDRVRKLVQGNKKFEAIDRAIGKDGFRVVTLLRLSPLLPLALSNYLYGLTSVPLLPYIAGSCLGMLPGTAAYVTAGSLGRAFILGSEEGSALPGVWQKAGLVAGVLITAFSATYVARQARKQLQEIEQESEEPTAAPNTIDEEAGDASGGDSDQHTQWSR